MTDAAATVLDLFSRVPAAFWGVVIGSFFTLGGITLTNRNSAKNLRNQLKHERDLRDRQREMDLRKEVYLAAAEAIAAGLQALGRLANVNTQREALDDFNRVAPAIAKVYMIGRIETIDAVVTVHADLTSGFLRITGYLLPVMILKNRVAVLSSRIDSFLATQKGLLEQILDEKLRGIPDRPKWYELQRQFTFETDRLNEAIAEKANVDLEFAAAQLSLAQSAINESEKVIRVLPTAVVALREELELHLDPDAFGAILQRSFQQQKPIFAQIVSEAQELISKANQPPGPPPPPKPPP